MEPKADLVPDLHYNACGFRRMFLTIKEFCLPGPGRHLLISLKPNDVDSQAELLYLPKKSTKPRSCLKFKGNLVSAVAFRY